MRKILIVEDDQFLREFYEELLTAEGYVVETAPEGETGLNKIQNNAYDLVLLEGYFLKEIQKLEIYQPEMGEPLTCGMENVFAVDPGSSPELLAESIIKWVESGKAVNV